MAECVFQGSYLVSIIRVSAGKQKSHLVAVFAYMLLDNMVISNKLINESQKNAQLCIVQIVRVTLFHKQALSNDSYLIRDFDKVNAASLFVL